ncbi:putative NADH dehydrogenase [ubiquinone] iron-sulfur protein 6-like protein, partial [Leptotrombidium deliense]
TKPIACKDRVVSCDGGDGPLGHPRVFINLDQPGNHSCGYCGLSNYCVTLHNSIIVIDCGLQIPDAC